MARKCKQQSAKDPTLLKMLWSILGLFPNMIALPATNKDIQDPENQWLEDEMSFWDGLLSTFRGELFVLGIGIRVSTELNR